MKNNWFYHVTTYKKLNKYQLTGTIKQPVRGWNKIEDAVDTEEHEEFIEEKAEIREEKVEHKEEDKEVVTEDLDEGKQAKTEE